MNCWCRVSSITLKRYLCWSVKGTIHISLRKGQPNDDERRFIRVSGIVTARSGAPLSCSHASDGGKTDVRADMRAVNPPHDCRFWVPGSTLSLTSRISFLPLFACFHSRVYRFTSTHTPLMNGRLNNPGI